MQCRTDMQCGGTQTRRPLLPSPGLRSDPAQCNKRSPKVTLTQTIPKSSPKVTLNHTIPKSDWVSVSFGERLLHWAGSECRHGDGSSGAGHPETGARGGLRSLRARSARRARPRFRCPAPLLLPSRLRSSALQKRRALHVRPTPGQKAGTPGSLVSPY